MVQKNLLSDLVNLRRTLHSFPEVGLHLPQTQSKILDALSGLPLRVTTGEKLSSVVAVLNGEHPGAPVLLRADMDALPIREQTGLEFASSNGSMHACGHDLHVAGLVGAARILSANISKLSGPVIFVFQPGEEGYDGAQHMLDEALLSVLDRPIAEAFAVHVMADEPYGQFSTRPGAVLSSYDTMDVTIIGAGGHGSKPHTALDPISVAAEIASGLQIFVAKRVDIFNPVVLSVGQLNGGTAPNIIPDEATMTAGIRSFDLATQNRLERELVYFVERSAEAYGLRAKVQYRRVFPATINDGPAGKRWLDTARSLFGADRALLMDNPKMASEDFSKVLAEVPGAYGFIGAAPRTNGEESPDASSRTQHHPNHSSYAVFDDGILLDQARFLAALVPREGQARASTPDSSILDGNTTSLTARQGGHHEDS